MQKNAQLKKQWWTTEKKSKLGALTQNQTTERTDLQRYDQKNKEKRDCYFFLLLTCFANLSLTSKWVFTRVQWTQNSRDRKRWREQRKNFQKLATTLRQVPLVRNNVKILLLCCCCSNNTISTSVLPLSGTRRDELKATVQHRQWRREVCVCLSDGDTHTEGVSAAAASDECSHCEQRRRHNAYDGRRSTVRRPTAWRRHR